MRRRPGRTGESIKVRRGSGKVRWTCGYGVWVKDVFVFRGSPSPRASALFAVHDIVTLRPTDDDRTQLRGLDASPVLIRLLIDDGYVDFATAADCDLDLFGPFVVAAVSREPIVAADRHTSEMVDGCDPPGNMRTSDNEGFIVLIAALLAVLGVDLIVIAAFGVVVLARRRWLSDRPGVRRGGASVGW
jgi:hypothetical protein